MMKLTKSKIENTPHPPKGQIFLRETTLPGFGMRITPGKKAWVLEKKIKGRSRRIKIGDYPGLLPEEARKRAYELIVKIAKGEDPRPDRKRETTLGELIDTYMMRHASRKKSGARDEELARIYLTRWYKRPLSDIQRADVARLHAKIGKTAPYRANRLVALLRTIFNLGVKWELFKGWNPAEKIDLFKEQKRDRYLKPDELPRIIDALREEKSPYIQAVFLVLLLTGQRKGEVLSMRWTDVDLKEATWRIPDTKAGRPHLVPLPDAVVKIFARLPRQYGSPYVFPGRKLGQHMTAIDKAWQRIRARADLKDVRIHDLRRTVGSWLAGSGTSLPIIGKVLNHSQPSTTAVYARLDLDPIRKVLEANAQKMIEVGKIAIEGVNDER